MTDDTLLNAPEHSAITPDYYHNHPSGIRCEDIVCYLPFFVGCAVKYLWRLGNKDDELQELDKALKCIDRELAIPRHCWSEVDNLLISHELETFLKHEEDEPKKSAIEHLVRANTRHEVMREKKLQQAQRAIELIKDRYKYQ